MRILTQHLPTILIAALGTFGIALILWAWQLPPFGLSEVRTANAYLRGNVTMISAQAAGEIDEVLVSDFETVEEGDVLARLDARSAEGDLAQAKAQLASARAAREAHAQAIRSAEATLASRQAGQAAAQAALGTAESTASRQHKLSDRGVVADRVVDDADLALRQAQSALTAARSNVDVAREALESTRLNVQALDAAIAGAEAAVGLSELALDHRVIRAPSDGRLGEVKVRSGQFVAAGTSLMSLVAPDLWVIANVKETELTDLVEGQEVEFTVDALRGRSFAGRLSVLAPATASEFGMLGSSPATGNFTKIAQRLPARIEIEPGQEGLEKLAPGMSVVLHANRQSPTPVAPLGWLSAAK